MCVWAVGACMRAGAVRVCVCTLLLSNIFLVFERFLALGFSELSVVFYCQTVLNVFM